MGLGLELFTIFSVVSAVAGAAGQYAQAQAQAASYENQARAQEANAKIAAMNADIAASEGKIARADTAREWYRNKGRQRAALAQGGILESSTGEALQNAADAEQERDLFQVQWNADMKAQGYKFESQDALAQASVSRGNASQARAGGVIGGLGSLAGGLSSAYTGYKLYGSGSRR